MRSVTRGIAALLLAGTLPLAGACSGGNHPGGGNGAGAATSGSYAVVVHSSGKTIRFAPDRLDGLAQVTVQTPDSAGATSQSGPRLSAVLNAAGVDAYRSVRVVGPSDSATLNRTEVGPDLLLAKTRRGTVKLAGPGLDPSRWVRDVTEVDVTQ